MPLSIDDLSATALTGMETALRLSTISLNCVERLMLLNLQLSKHLLDDQATLLQQAAQNGSPQNILDAMPQLAARTRSFMENGTQSLYQAFTSTQAELAKLNAAHMSQFGATMNGAAPASMDPTQWASLFSPAAFTPTANPFAAFMPSSTPFTHATNNPMLSYFMTLATQAMEQANAWQTNTPTPTPTRNGKTREK